MTWKIFVHKRTLSSLLLHPGSCRDGQTNPPNNGQYIWCTGRDCKPARNDWLTHNLRPTFQIIHNVSKTNCSGICTHHTQRQKIDSAIKMFMHLTVWNKKLTEISYINLFLISQETQHLSILKLIPPTTIQGG